MPEADLYDWFRRRDPDAFIGYSILIYEVTAPTGQWVAHCAAPAPLLAAEEAERLVGVSGARHLVFDCAANWVFPDEGAPGWYVLPPDVTPEWLINSLASEEAPTPVYSHRANEFGPAYSVYYWPGAADPATLLGPPPAAPLLAGGPAELRGYAAGGVAWLTLWYVAEATAAPLSVQAHLTAGDSSPQVADGLGFSSDQWRPGDWFIQRHVFAAPGDTLATGLYNYATLEPVAGPVTLPAP